VLVSVRVVMQHRRWHLHGWGQSQGVLVGVCMDLGDDMVQLWVGMGLPTAVGHSQAGRHCGGVGWAYLVVMWHWEWDVTGC